MYRLWILVVAIGFSNCNKISSDFLLQFFYDKPFMITAQLCWKYSDVSYLLKQNIESENPKQIAMYQDCHDYYNFLKYLSNNNYFVLDLIDCPNSWLLLDRINATLKFRFPLKFMLLINEDDFDKQLVDLLGNYTIFPSTELVVAKRMGDNFVLFQPYRIDNVHEIIWEKYGSWNKSGIYEILKNVPFPQRRSNMQYAKMNMVLYIEFPDTWNHLDDFKKPRIDTFTKQNYGAMKALTEYCYMNYTIIPTNIWGYYNETSKTWNGLIDVVSKSKAHIAGSSPYYTTQRFAIVDFIKMQNPLEIRFVLKKPPLSYMYNVFTLPFQTDVWEVLAGILVLFMIALYIILNWEVKHYEKINDKDHFTPSDVTLILFEAVCQQGTLTESRTISGRVLSLFLFLSFMFFYCSYSAYIVVLLQSTHTIGSYEELVSSSLEAGGMETSYMRVYLAGSKKLVQQQLYEKKIGPKGFYHLEEGMAKVQAGFFAFHAEIAGSYDYIAQKFTDYDTCNLQIMEGYNEYLKGYTSVPKNSPYKEIFKVGLMKIDEYGIQRRNYLRFIKKPSCYTGGGSFDSVGIIDMYNALLIWACGSGIGFIFFFIELIMYRRKMRKMEEGAKNRQNKTRANVDPPPTYQTWY